MAEAHRVFRPTQRQLNGFLAYVAGLKLWYAALAAVVLITLQGCATLPNAEREMAMPHAQQVEFEGTHGPISAAKSEVILSRLEGKDGASDVLQKHLAYEQAINADSPLVLGNKLTLLQDGPATYKAMFAAIRGAKDHINLETYIIDDDEVGKQFSDLLLQKQAQGVQVNMIYDSVGCLNTPQSFFDRLRAGGIQVLEFNPVNPLADNTKPWLLNNRDHRKLLVIDGRIAFVGGINISEVYSSSSLFRYSGKNSSKTTGWRDTHSQIKGPVVAKFQKLFMESWTKQKGPPLKQMDYFPKLDAQGEEIVRAIGNVANAPQSPIYLTLISAISHAEQEVHLTIAYFAPDSQLLKALTDAAQRGVEVKLILPSNSDSWAIFNLGRSYYTGLLSGGVKIYERRGAVMHSKTTSIDGVWSTIGSTNLDWRSFLHNDEINAVILGRDFAVQMDAMFAKDLEESDAITLDNWKSRPLMSRLKEWTARLGAYWL